MEKIEVPKPKWAEWKFSESMRSPKWWLGFLYGVTMYLGGGLLRGDSGILNWILSTVLAGFFGLLIAQAVSKTKDPNTIRVWGIGAILASVRTGVMVMVGPPISGLEIMVSLMWDLFLGACMGDYYRKLPVLMKGSVAAGGTLVGLIMVALAIPTEYQQWGRIILEQETIIAVLSGIVYGLYGGGVFGMTIATIGDSLKLRDVETAHQSTILPAPLPSSLEIIPMQTAMLTYKGTGVVCFGGLELKVNREQYTALKLGLTYRIEHREHDLTLLGFELVSKETPVLSKRFQD
jgi:hypothetical protein